ncbi:MAG: PLP-dependent aminotransferase family protein [Planctomycetes bacterium]|nr:PLP-dependent aminotransferase family protein [Planctomycetota bacterium]MCB9870214.1 PLP-dependent aminotransferase family protein [Planctomycetota bacterium]
MDLPDLRRDAAAPLVDQLVDHYRAAIREGRVRPGDRLPTIRAVASGAGVTRATVEGAYRRLQTLGLVAATVGRGTVVCGDAEPNVLSPGARAALDHLSQQPMPAAQPDAIDLAQLSPDHALFPAVDFAESLQRVLARRGSELLGYGQPTGDLELRRLLAAMTDTPPEQAIEHILVTNGAQQGLDLVLRAFTRPGDAVAVPVPTYHHLLGLLKAQELRAVPVRGSADGIDLDDLARVLGRDDVRLLYLMPTFRNPTGSTLDLAQRQRLVEIVARTTVPVLEDEFDLDLRFRGAPLPSLFRLDPRQLTVTVRTFSKGLFPGVRLGWVHAGPEVFAPLAALKRYIDLETSPLLQAALVDFLRSGAADRHLTALRDEVRDRHAAAQQALEQHMPDGFRWTRPDGGFALWVEGPPGFDGIRLAQAAAERGVLVAPGCLFHPSDASVPGVRVSLCRAGGQQVRTGIEILGRCAAELLGPASPSRQPFLL